MNHVVRNAWWMISVYFTKAEKTAPWKQQYFRRNTTEISASAPMPWPPFCTMAAALQPLQRMLFLRVARAPAQLPIHAHTVGDCWTQPPNALYIHTAVLSLRHTDQPSECAGLVLPLGSSRWYFTGERKQCSPFSLQTPHFPWLAPAKHVLGALWDGSSSARGNAMGWHGSESSQGKGSGREAAAPQVEGAAQQEKQSRVWNAIIFSYV